MSKLPKKSKVAIFVILATLIGSTSYFLHKNHTNISVNKISNTSQVESSTEETSADTKNKSTTDTERTESAESTENTVNTENTVIESKVSTSSESESESESTITTDNKEIKVAQEAMRQAKIAHQLASLPHLHINTTNKDSKLNYRQLCEAIATVANTYIYDLDFNKGAFVTYSKAEDACTDPSLSPEFKQQCQLIKGSIHSLQKPVVDPIPGKILPYAYLEGDHLGYRVFLPQVDLSTYQVVKTADQEIYSARDNKAEEELVINFYKGYQGNKPQIDILTEEEVSQLQSSNSIRGFKFDSNTNYKLEVLSAVLDHGNTCSLDVVPVPLEGPAPAAAMPTPVVTTTTVPDSAVPDSAEQK